MKVTLSPALQRFVTGKVKTGWYSTPEEVVADALRRWKEADEYEPEWLEEEIEKGLNSGPTTTADKEFWTRLRRDVHRELKTRTSKPSR